jgi:hypothetical protein
MQCLAASHRLQDLADGTLPARQATRLQAHAERCGVCAAALACWRRLLAALDELPRDVAPPDFAASVLARIAIVPRRQPPRDRSRCAHRRRAPIWATLLVLVLASPAPAAGPRMSPPPAAAVGPDSAAAPAGEAPAVRRKTAAYELVRFGRDVHVHEDEVVRGDILLVSGDLRVDGEIEGGALVVGGDVYAGPRARIAGETVAVGGRVDTAQGASIHEAVSLSVFSTPFFARFGSQRTRELLSDLLKLLCLVVVAVPVCALFGRPLERARARLHAAPLKCLGLGALALPGGAFAIVVVAFLLALTLVGVPLAVVLVVVAVLVGVAALFTVAAAIGARLRAVLPPLPARLYVQVAIGLVCLRLPELVADVIAISAPERSVAALRVLDGALVVATLAAGLGALLWMRWQSIAKA